jgi:PAS domain S-box-containing protein
MTSSASTNDEREQLRRRVAELEAKLADHEQRWRSIVHNAPDIFIVIDRQGVIREISRPERPREDVVGAVSFDFLVPDHRESVKAAVAQVFESGKRLTREVQEQAQGRWYSVRLAPLPRAGVVDSVIVICTDISQRKRQEDELRASEARLRSLLKQLPAIVFTTDRELRLTSSMGAGLERLGLKPDETVGRTVFDYFATEDPTFRPIAAMLSSLEGRTETYEVEWQGNVYHAVSEPLRDAQGRIEGTLGVALDVTQQRQIELALRDSEQRFRQMAESIHEVFYLTDPDGHKLLYVSPHYEAIWGRPREQLFRDPRIRMESIHPDDRAAVRENVAKLRQGQDRSVMQFRVVRPDGAVRWIEDRCFVIRGAGGGLERIAGICADITDRKLAEDKLLTAHDELGRLVAERTRDLRRANRQLRSDIEERKRMAAALSESESRFRVLAEGSPIPVVIARPQTGEILYGNRRLAELLGVPEESLPGRRMTEFYDDPTDRDALLAELGRDAEVRDRELRFRRADGRRLWVTISLRGIVYDGQPQLYSGLVDITKIKETEESLRAERRLLRRLLDLHERDRQLVAYEIHDGMVQDMTGAAMFVEAAHHLLSDRPKEHGQLAHALKLLRASIGEARRLINGLRPPILENEGLVPAIANLVEEVQSTANLEIDFRHKVRFGRIAPAMEMAIYRTVQESLNNVWQHSGSRRARVELVQLGDEARVTVEDWGCGFDPSQVGQKRYGLQGVRERARLLGGRAKISSSPGQGTRIDVVLPLTDVLLPSEPHQAAQTEIKSAER